MAIEQRKYEGGDIFINPKEKVINPNAIGMQNFDFFTLHTIWGAELWSSAYKLSFKTWTKQFNYSTVRQKKN